MKRFPLGDLRQDDKTLCDDLSGKFIFVGSSTDMWAKEIPAIWILDVISRCLNSTGKFLFQTKNPAKFVEYSEYLSEKWLLATTIESNRYYPEISKAPVPEERKLALHFLSQPLMISIEPVMDFDLDVMVQWIKEIKPQFVSIGSDSGNNHLPEPSPVKLKALIESLKEFTEVKVKDNLKRLL
jgi:protein gp37